MNYDMTFCTGEKQSGEKAGPFNLVHPCPLRYTCGRFIHYIDRPKDRPLSWFVDPPFEGDTCEHYKPLSKNTREGE